MYKLIYKNVFSKIQNKEFTLPRGILIGGKEIILPCSIATYSDNKTPFIVEISDLLIVCFSPFTAEELKEMEDQSINGKRNIWAFDLKGNKVWEVMEANNEPNDNSHAYASIWIKNQQEIAKTWAEAALGIWAKVKDGSLIAGNVSGTHYIVDISNGHVEAVRGLRLW